MTCRQLGGACDLEFSAETFEEMAETAKKHGVEMYEQGEEEHIKALDVMKTMMENPEVIAVWMDTKKREFEGLPEE